MVVEYKISSYPSKFAGYQSKKQTNGTVKIFISTLWKYAPNFDDFLFQLNYIIILERICLERGFQKIRMKNRCNPCQMERYAIEMMKPFFQE